MGSLTVDCIREQKSINFVLSGRIDASNAYSFSDAITSALVDGHEEAIVFDCGGLEYISSMGLRALLSLRKKKRNVAFRLMNVSHSVMSILELTGFTQIFDVTGGN